MSAQKYRKKPVEIEAMHFASVDDGSRIAAWCGGSNEKSPHEVQIETLEGTMTASLGDYVIKGVQGEFYPCKPDIFAATYDEGPQRPRTAVGIGSFYKELLEEGVPQELAYEVVRDAARPLTGQHGIVVKDPASVSKQEVSV